MEKLKSSVTAKLTTLFLAFSILPMVVIFPIFFHEFGNLKTAIMGEKQEAATTINDIIDRNMFERYGDVQAFSINKTAMDAKNWKNPSESNSLINSMNGFMQKYGMYKIMLLVSPGGEVLAVNSQDAVGKPVNTKWIYEKNFAKAPWLAKALKGDFLKSDVLTGTVVEEPSFSDMVAKVYNEDGYTIPLAAPVQDETGKNIAVWVNFMDFNVIEQMVSQYYQRMVERNMANSEITILDRNGTVIVDFDIFSSGAKEYKRDPETVGKLNLVEKGFAAAKESTSGKNGSAVARHERKNVEQAVGYSHSKGAFGYPGLNWSVLVRTSAAEAFSVINSGVRTLEIVAVIAIGVLLAAGIYIGNYSSKPLRRIKDVIERLARGDNEVELVKAGTDEIGQIVVSLGTLVESNNLAQSNLEKLISAASKGNLNERINSQSLEGSFKRMAEGMNGLMNTINEPVKKLIESLNAVAQGDLSHKMDGSFQGAFAEMQKSVNASIDTIKLLQEKVGELVQAASIGVLNQQIDLSLFEGQFKSLAESLNSLVYTINDPIKKLIASLNAVAKGDLSHKMDGDFRGAFSEMQKSVNGSIDTIKLIQEKVGELVQAASAGEVDERIDSSIFEGQFRNLAESLNGLMEEINRPISAAVESLNRLAEGDLTRKMEGDFRGAFGQIQNSLNNTFARIAETVTEIKQSSESVSTAAKEISSGSSDLSSRTEQQASSLEQTAASMEELTGSARGNAKNAFEANRFSTEAREEATKGDAVLKETINAMKNIENSSQRISDIISVIDEIAFQTNLLALNAAVEAARAGEAGKGFAVVASEVRSLAGRSSSASKEIKGLINASSAQVKEGSALVNKSGEALQSIIDKVKSVAELVESISAASNEQTTGIEEINSALSHMDEVTQQNAALVEENTAATESLVQQGARLNQLIGFFRVGEGDERSEHHVVNLPHTEKKPSPVKATHQVKKPAAKIASISKTVAKLTASQGGSVHNGEFQGAKGWEEF